VQRWCRIVRDRRVLQKAAIADHAAGVAWFVVRAGLLGARERGDSVRRSRRQRLGRRAHRPRENAEKAVAERQKGRVDYGTGRAAAIESP
jgi:hypothetical protein